MITRSRETLDPEDLERLGSIFDEAWSLLAPGLQHRGEAAVAEARARLAGIMLELCQHQLMSGSLKKRALRIFFEDAQPHRAEGSVAHSEAP